MPAGTGTVYSTAASIIGAYRNMLNATHNATQFAFIQGNRGRTTLRGRPQAELTRLAMEARDLTGNPQTSGRYYTPTGRPIKFDTRNSDIGQRIGAGAARTFLAVNEAGRKAVPWYNMTQQGIRRFGVAFMNNPAEFSARALMWYIMPPALGYYLAAYMGKDPNGVSYLDHMMHRRDEYRQSMFQYIPIPGRPAEDGIEFPWFQEGVLPKRMIEATLNHLWGDNAHTYGEDFKAALLSALDVAVLPPMNPILSAASEAFGNAAPQNFGALIPGLGKYTGIGGESFQRRDDPFDVNKAMPATIEATVRALAPSIADIFGSGFAAASHTETDAMDKIKNFFKAAGRKMTERTPILRDIADIHTPITGNSRFTSDMFRRERSIEQLDTFFKTFGTTGETQIGRAKPLSKSGFNIAQQATGNQSLPPSIPGLAQPEPTNPLYKMFAKELYDKTKHDSVNTGGVGFRSIWDEYRNASKAIRTMRNIDAGNMVTWQRQVQARPDLIQMLKIRGIDANNPYAVRNFYERRRQDVARVINDEITKLETSFSSRLGYPIKIEDLDPYKAPNFTATTVPDAAEQQPWNPEP